MSQKPKSGTVARFDSTQIKPSELTIIIKHMMNVNIRNASKGKKRRGLMIWGGPGIGKSALAAQAASSMNFLLIDIRLATMEPTDLRGIPVPMNMNSDESPVVKWAIPALFPKFFKDPVTGKVSRNARIVSPVTGHVYDGAIIFLDELPNAPGSVQASSYQLVLDAALGEWDCPDNVVVMAAGNRETDKGGTYKMPKPLENRFTHVDLKHDYEDWLVNAINDNYHQDVIGYVSAYKAELYQFDAKSASRAFPTPRAWEAVSDIIFDDPNLPEQCMIALVGGTVGDGIAVKFLEHRKNAARLPKAADILDGKVTSFNIGSEAGKISLMYSLTTSMCYELKERYQDTILAPNKPTEATKKKFTNTVDNFLGFMMEFFQPELVIMGARTALSVFKIKFDPDGMKNWDEFSDKYQDLILAA